MYSIDLFVAEAKMATHTITAQQSARQRRLLCQTREQRQSRVSQPGGRFVHRLGHHLVMLGEWLEATGHAQPSF